MRRDFELSAMDHTLLQDSTLYTPYEQALLSCLRAHTIEVPLSNTGKRVVYSINVRSLSQADVSAVYGPNFTAESMQSTDFKQPPKPRSGGGGGAPAVNWECAACTYINAATASKCGMCDGTVKRPVSVSNSGSGKESEPTGAASENGAVKAPEVSPPLQPLPAAAAVAPPPVSMDEKKPVSSADSKQPPKGKTANAAASPTATKSAFNACATTPTATATATAPPLLSFPSGRTILMLHGFGSRASWATWSKLVAPLFAHGYNFLLCELPGFNQSSGRDTQTTVWRADGPDLVRAALVGGFGVSSGVSVVAHCGGAGTIFSSFPYLSRYRLSFALTSGCFVFDGLCVA